MNQTMYAVKEIIDRYYWIGDKCFDKNVVHGIVIFVIISSIIIVGYYLISNLKKRKQQ